MAKGSAAEATDGTLYIELCGRPVWGVDRIGVNWFWVELLEHLASNWISLVFEETDPIGLNARPTEIRRAAQRRWKALAREEQVDREQRALLRFERSHNLAHALAGAAVADLWVIRMGAEAEFTTSTQAVRRPFAEIERTLVTLGDQIAERITALEDPRAREAVDAWHHRGVSEPKETIVARATGFTRERISAIQGTRSTHAAWGLGSDTQAPTPQLIAARMLGHSSPPHVVGAVIDWIARCPPPNTAQLEALRNLTLLAETELRGSTSNPSFKQGYQLGLWFRSLPGVVDPKGYVDPESFLCEAGVRIEEQDLGIAEVDAVACWSLTHGPAILINRDGKHAQGVEGRRTTLAHELCHLLIDRRHSLPAAEVMGGRAPPLPEKRANAFAVEILVPRNEAATLRTGDPRRIVSALRKRFVVSAEAIAWQAANSGEPMSKKARDYLLTLIDPADREKFLKTAIIT